jgi:hypothetical protein
MHAFVLFVGQEPTKQAKPPKRRQKAGTVRTVPTPVRTPRVQSAAAGDATKKNLPLRPYNAMTT